MVLFLAILVGILAIVTVILVLQGNARYSWVQFYARGKEAGFTMSELGKLKGFAIEAGMEEPTALFWSANQLDACIKKVAQGNMSNDLIKKEDVHKFLTKLYDYRKRVEFEQPKYKNGIKSSRNIVEGQRLKVLLQGQGVYNAQVIENTQKSLAVSYPTGLKPSGSLKNKRVNVYFWRQEDAGYVFDTYVIEDKPQRGVPVLNLAHSDSLFRAQKRKSIRQRSKIPAYLYLMKRIEGAYEKAERTPGMRCIVQDISEDGAAILIGGKAVPGLKIKIQFNIGDSQIVMSGIVKGLEYSKETNQSLMHLQATTPSPRMRNLLLAYVFKLFEVNDDSPAASDEYEEELESPEEPENIEKATEELGF